MKKLLFAGLLALLSLSAAADYSFVAPSGDYVVLHETSCPAQLTELARQAGVKPDIPLYSAEAVVNGQHFNACWANLDAPYVGIVYEDGDRGLIPKELLKKLRDA